MTEEVIIQPAHWKFNALYKRGKTYKVYDGGRGGMKSWELAKALVYYCARYDDFFGVVCRETEVSLKHSAQKLMWDTIKRYELEDQFTNMVGMIRHNYNGSFIIFKGIGADPDSIKSMEGADVVWVEEAQTISNASLDILIPTITRKDGAEIWFSYNPRFRTDAVSVMFADGHPMAEIYHINYTENPFISNAFIEEAEELKRKNPKLYGHIYMGQFLDDSTLLIVSSVLFGEAQAYPNDICVVGVDIARDGGDALTVWVRRGRNIVETQKHHNMDLDKLSSVLLEVNRIHKPDRINIDSTGHGAWAADGLKRAGLDNVYSINFAEEAWEPEKYSNKRTNLYALAPMFFDGGGRLPAGSVQVEKELLSSRYTFDTKNRARLIPKDEIKRIIGCSPDEADGFVLCLYTGNADMFEKPIEYAQNPVDLSRAILNAAAWNQ